MAEQEVGFEIVIRISAINSATNDVVLEQWGEAPDGVDAYNIESMLRQSFGEPLDRALDRHDTHGVISIGWYFSGDSLERFGMPADGNDALVIPYARFADGSQTPLFVLAADERAKAERLFGRDQVTYVDARTEYEPPAAGS